MIPEPLEGPGQLLEVRITTASPSFATPLGTSRSLLRHRRVAYLHVVTTEGIGVGELAAMDETVGNDPSLDQVLLHLQQVWLPKLWEAARARAGACPGSHLISTLGSMTPADRMAGSALEMAVLDLELRRQDLSLAAWLGAPAAAIRFGGLVGIPEDRSVHSAVAAATALIERGVSRLRLKVAPGFSAAPARALVALGDCDVQADANGCFSLPESGGIEEELRELDATGLACIEQPIGGHDLTAMARARDELLTPLCLDELASGVPQVRSIIRYAAASSLCLKPGRAGGIRPTLRMLEMATAANLPCFIGGMFETGLARAILGVLAQHPQASMVSDVVAPVAYFRDDPCRLEAPIGTLQPVWSRPGVGPHPDPAVLTTLIVDRR